MNLQRPYLNPKPIHAEGWCSECNFSSWCFLCHHHTINCYTFDGNELGGKGDESIVDNHCISAHLCCRHSIAWNSWVFPPLHPVSGRQTRRHITVCTVCGRQFLIRTHCRSVKSLMSCLALKTGDHNELQILVPCAISGISVIHSEEATSACAPSQR